MHYTLLLMFLGVVDGALRNVSLIIEPSVVNRGQHARLSCLYNLEGAPLHSMKFYCRHLEFYRYTPGELPHSKFFTIRGVNIDVSIP